MLCTYCSEIVRWAEGMFRNLPLPEDFSQKSRDFQPFRKIQIAAKGGCSVCSVVLRRTKYSEDATRKWYLEEGLQLKWNEFSLQGTALYTHSILMSDAANKCPTCLRSEASLRKSPDLDLVKQWYEHCRDNHPRCRRARTRLMTDIRLLDVSHSTRFRLVENPGEDVDYATLSHRWGHQPFVKLTSQNRASMISSLPIQILSPIFQDAIVVTKALGLSYLWIDALCIIQGADLDIEAAACNMAEIYCNGVCNISGLAANPKGLLFQRNITSVGNFVVACKHDTAAETCYSLAESDAWMHEVEETPLRNRGWIAQEQILSSRAVLFGVDQIFWQCSYEKKFENQFPHIQHQPTSPIDQLERMISDALIHRRIDQMTLTTSWNVFVMNYSHRQLTNVSDRLLAVAGIASALGSSSGDVYLAGLWKSSMPACLCWSNGSLSKSLSPMYWAPSWSWASMHSSVRLMTSDHTHLTKFAKLTDCVIHNLSDNPYGRVEKASLWIQGIIRSIGLEPTKEAMRSVFSATDQDASGEYEADPHMDTRSFSHEEHPEIFALSILVGGGGDPGKHEVTGILLRRVVGTLASQSRCKPRNGFSMKPDDVFQRVGRFNFRGHLNDFGGLLRFHDDHRERPGVLINMKQWHEEAKVIEII